MSILQKTSDPDWATCGDAAFAANLDGTAFDSVGGYLHSPNAYHPWDEADWFAIPGPKLPIWVANGTGQRAGTNEANLALEEMRHLGIEARKGIWVCVDMETRIDPAYVAAFGALLQHYGFNGLVYGSASTVFNNPKLNGYWVADYIFKPFMYNHMGVRMTQWTDGELYDQSTVKRWILTTFWR